MNSTSRSGSGKGAGFSSTELTTEKIAVFVPIPSVRAATAAAVKPGILPEDAKRVLDVLQERFHVSL